MTHDDYFERKGCYYLAMALIRDSLTQLIADPQFERVETRIEMDWLRGHVTCSPVTAAEVFETLGIGDYVDRFAELAAKDPKGVMDSIRGLNHVLDEMASPVICDTTPMDVAVHGGLESAVVSGVLEQASPTWPRERERSF